MSSTKSSIGHLLGARFGGSDLLPAGDAGRHGAAHHQIWKNPNVTTSIDLVPLKGAEAQCEVAMSNSFGFGAPMPH